jgi:4-hydroxy-tetrahydrodipicolinate synthase
MITPFVNTAKYDKYHREILPIDGLAYENLLDYQIAAGNGLVILGTTAETTNLSVQERERLVKAAVKKASGRVPVVVGVGSNNMDAAIKNTENAIEWGADGILVVNSPYDKQNKNGLLGYYGLLNQFNIPMIAYNVPGRTGANVTPELQLAIAEKCENVIGVKEASGNLGQIKAVIDTVKNTIGRPYRVWSGDDGLTGAMLLAGGDGVISVVSNGAPNLVHAFVESYVDYQNDRGPANPVLNVGAYQELSRLFFLNGNPVTPKYIMWLCGLIASPAVRMPLGALDDNGAKEKIVAATDVLKIIHGERQAYFR